jgi:hypothetical protein
MALVGVAVAACTYLLGAFILSGFGIVASFLYLGYCAFVELSILRKSCVHCCYYGEVCGLGRGRLCSLLFEQGSPESGLDRDISARDLVPDILVSAIPLLGGIVLLVGGMSWPVLVAMVMILLLASAGNALVRGRIACRHCAQGGLGCPADGLLTPRAGREQ